VEETGLMPYTSEDSRSLDPLDGRGWSVSSAITNPHNPALIKAAVGPGGVAQAHIPTEAPGPLLVARAS